MVHRRDGRPVLQEARGAKLNPAESYHTVSNLQSTEMKERLALVTLSDGKKPLLWCA